MTLWPCGHRAVREAVHDQEWRRVLPDVGDRTGGAHAVRDALDTAPPTSRDSGDAGVVWHGARPPAPVLRPRGSVTGAAPAALRVPAPTLMLTTAGCSVARSSRSATSITSKRVGP